MHIVKLGRYRSYTTNFILRSAFIALFAIAFTGSVRAQTSAEFFTSSIASIPNGPSTANQTARLLPNTNNPTGNTIGTVNTTVNVTAALSNQQYTGVNTGTGNPVVFFGATVNGASTTPVAQATFREMNAVGAPANNQFSNTPTGTTTGMDVAVNHGFNMFSSVQQWTTNANPSRTGRIYLSNLTLTFSSPVTNPLLQISGLGGTSGNGQGFSTELTLTSAGLSLVKVAGNADLVVTGTQINNSHATGIDASCTTNASCGTVRVVGANITTIAFQVFVRGDGGGGTTWSTAGVHAGDQWMLGVSLPEVYDLSGKVFRDVNGATNVDGTAINSPAGTQLYVNIIDTTDGTVIGTVPVAANGTYSFTGLPASVNYRVELSINQGTVGAAAPARALPAGWFYLAENVGTTGNDGSPNGQLNPVAVGTATLVNVNFGINTAPTAANVGITGRVLRADGRFASNVVVTVLDGTTSEIRVGRTNQLGYFRIMDLEAGSAYVVTVNDTKHGKSISRLVQAMDDLQEVNFILE